MIVKGSWTMADIAKLGDRESEDFQNGFSDFCRGVAMTMASHSCSFKCSILLSYLDPIPHKIIIKTCERFEIWKAFALKHGIVEEEEKRYRPGQWFRVDYGTTDAPNYAVIARVDYNQLSLLCIENSYQDCNRYRKPCKTTKGWISVKDLTEGKDMDGFTFTPIDKSEVKL